MKTIILGKEGNQPFKIENGGVSRRHAQVTISDDGEWILEDLGSSNGTFIRDEKDGKLVRVGNVKLTPMTFICLGPDNSKGCSFYARQILPENYNNFNEEYEYLRGIMEKYDDKLEKVDKNMRRVKWVSLIVNLLIIILSIVLEHLLPEKPGMNFWLLRGGTILTSTIALLYDGSAIKKKIEKERMRFSHCPNPKCDHILKAADVMNYKCPKCKLPK